MKKTILILLSIFNIAGINAQSIKYLVASQSIDSLIVYYEDSNGNLLDKKTHLSYKTNKTQIDFETENPHNTSIEFFWNYCDTVQFMLFRYSDYTWTDTLKLLPQERISLHQCFETAIFKPRNSLVAAIKSFWRDANKKLPPLRSPILRADGKDTLLLHFHQSGYPYYWNLEDINIRFEIKKGNNIKEITLYQQDLIPTHQALHSTIIEKQTHQLTGTYLQQEVVDSLATGQQYQLSIELEEFPIPYLYDFYLLSAKEKEALLKN